MHLWSLYFDLYYEQKSKVILLMSPQKSNSLSDFLPKGNLHRNMTATRSAFGDLGALVVVTSQV